MNEYVGYVGAVSERDVIDMDLSMLLKIIGDSFHRHLAAP